MSEKKGVTEEYIRQTSRYKRFFSYDAENKEILLLGNPISHEDLTEIQRIRKRHVIPESHPRNIEKYYLKSLIWTIANQRINYERALKFMNSLHGLTIEELRNPGLIYNIAREGELSWIKENKFEPALDYMKENGGIKEVVKTLLENPYNVRGELSRIKWLHLKSASLWYLALGGDESLLIIDSHNAGQAAALGIEVPEKTYFGYRVGSGKNEGKREKSSLSRGQYLQVEQDILNLVHTSNLREKYPKFLLNEKGTLDGGFLSILLWWTSVQAYRKMNLRQRDLFGMSDSFISPYGIRSKKADLEKIVVDAFKNNMTPQGIRIKYGITRASLRNSLDLAIKEELEIGKIKVTQQLKDEWIAQAKIAPHIKLSEKDKIDIARKFYIEKINPGKLSSEYDVNYSTISNVINISAKEKWEIEGTTITEELKNERRSEVCSYARSKVKPNNIIKAGKAGGKSTWEKHYELMKKNLANRGLYSQRHYRLDGISDIIFRSRGEAFLAYVFSEYRLINLKEGEDVHKIFKNNGVKPENEDTSFDFGLNVENNEQENIEDIVWNTSAGDLEVDFFIQGKVIEYHPPIIGHSEILDVSSEKYLTERLKELQKRGFEGSESDIVLVEGQADYQILQALNLLGIQEGWETFTPKYKIIKNASKDILKKVKKPKKIEIIEEDLPF